VASYHPRVGQGNPPPPTHASALNTFFVVSAPGEKLGELKFQWLQCDFGNEILSGLHFANSIYCFALNLHLRLLAGTLKLFLQTALTF
jgi:hypothetical protein